MVASLCLVLHAASVAWLVWLAPSMAIHCMPCILYSRLWPSWHPRGRQYIHITTSSWQAIWLCSCPPYHSGRHHLGAATCTERPSVSVQTRVPREARARWGPVHCLSTCRWGTPAGPTRQVSHYGTENRRCRIARQRASRCHSRPQPSERGM